MDLMYLYKMPTVSIQKIIKTVLQSYVIDRTSKNGISERVIIPRIEHKNPLPKSVQFHVYIDDNNDKKIVEWIDKIPKGFRNGMIKNILRGYMNFPMTIPYETNIINEINNGKQDEKSPISKLNQSLSKTHNNALKSNDIIKEKKSEQTQGNQENKNNISKNQNTKVDESDVFDDFEDMMEQFN